LQKTDAGHVVFEKQTKLATKKVETELLRPAGPAREIPLGDGKSRIAIAPVDSDFSNAAVWKIKLPADWNAEHHLGAGGKADSNTPGRCPALLRIRYVGDVARLTLNGKLLDDNFYSGREFDLGLNRYTPGILNGDLRLEILPLRQNAPIFFEPKAKPDFGTNETLVKLLSADIVR